MLMVVLVFWFVYVSGQLSQSAASLREPLSIDEADRLLGHTDPAIRAYAASYLGMLGKRAAPEVPALTARLTDPIPMVRRAAALALGQIGPDAESAVSSLILLVNDDDQEVRHSAVLALGMLGPASADVLPILNQACKDSNESVSMAACWSSEQIALFDSLLTPEELREVKGKVHELLANLEEGDPFQRYRVAVVFRQLGADAALARPALVKMLSDPYLFNQRAAKRALQQIED